MKRCNRCGSFAINHHSHGRDGSDPDLCDVCYWRKRAEFGGPIVTQPLTADGMKEPKNGEHWRVEWWNESCRMMLPTHLKLDRFQSYKNGTLTLPLFRVVLSPMVTRLFYAVPRTSVARTASG